MSKHRVIDVKKQHSMSLGETFTLCVKGVKHRMLRSVLTLAVVVLAVAFFMFLLSESMFIRATGRGVDSEIKHERISQQTLSRFFTPATELVTIRRLASSSKNQDSVQLQEYANVTGFTREAVDALAVGALWERTYIDWLAAIPTGKRTVLIHKTSGREAINFILTDLEGFHSRIAPMIDLQIPGKIQGLDAFLAGYIDYAKKLTALNQAWNEKVLQASGILKDAKGSTVVEDADWIVGATETDVGAWRSKIAALGFHFETDQLVLMRSQLALTKECDAIFKALNSKEFRERWATEFRETNPSTAEQKMARLGDARAVDIFKGEFDPDVLARASKKTLYQQRLTKLERKLAPSMAESGGFLGLSGRQIFLLSISFLVCMVGISNAMLMSITERFREIATMKCLGATDSYILLQFMMEAGMQGFCGGLLGVAIGFVIAALRGLTSFGYHLTLYWPGLDLVGCAVVSIFAGVLLAILASIQPSWSASRMAPMEAMRVE